MTQVSSSEFERSDSYQPQKFRERRIAATPNTLYSPAVQHRTMDAFFDDVRAFGFPTGLSETRQRELGETIFDFAREYERVKDDKVKGTQRAQRDELIKHLNTEPSLSKIKDAIYELINANYRLVYPIALNFTASSGIPIEDTFQMGVDGLMEAAYRFNYQKARFSTHATSWISQAITRGLQDEYPPSTIRIPVWFHDEHAKFAQAAKDVSDKKGRQATYEEIAEYMGGKFTPAYIQDLVTTWNRTHTAESVEEDFFDEEQDAMISRAVTIAGPDLILSTQENDLQDEKSTLSVLSYDLSILTPKQRVVIELYFGLVDGISRDLDDVAKKLQVTSENTRQLLVKGINTLRGENGLLPIKNLTELSQE